MASAVVYARLSDVRKGDTEGIDRQVREAEAHAQRLSVDVVERLVDNDISAAKKVRRPAFERLLEGIAAGEWDVVIFRSMDRWVRRPAELEKVIDLLESSPPVRFETIHSGPVTLNTPEGRLQARNATNYSAYEVEQVRRRVTDWHKDRAARGLAIHGAPGFGYRKVEGRMEIHAEEAEQLREAARRLVEGEALAAIAREWGVGPSTVKRALLAPRTAGLRVHRKQVVGDAAWPAILDRFTWERVKAILTNPARNSVGGANRSSKLLTGLAVCRCGKTLNSRVMHGRRRYYCRHCFGTTISADQLDRHVTLELLAGVDRPELARRVDAVPDVDEQAVTQKILELEAERDAYAAQVGRGEIHRSEWDSYRPGVEKRLADLKAQLGQPRGPKPWQGEGAALAIKWDGWSVAEQRAVLRQWVAEVKIGEAKMGDNRWNPQRVEIRWVE